MSEIGTKRTLPPSSGVSDPVQAKDARLEPDRYLAKRRVFRKGGDESLTVLDAIRGAVAKILGRHDDFLG